MKVEISKNQEFSTLWNLTSCKKAKKTNDGKYENFCDGQTDRQTDTTDFKGHNVCPKRMWILTG